jgi:pimeloyl-ACP methyl ester carboxylesterase
MNGISPASSYFSTADGVRLYYETRGSGPNTLIIPNGVCLMDDLQRLAVGRTIIAYDLRNRGRSDAVDDAVKLERGILNDVDDLDKIRQHFGLDQIDLLGHSYMGLMVVLYAMKYAQHVHRAVQIGASPPHAEVRYPVDLAGSDGVLNEVFKKLGELRKEMTSKDPVEVCRRFWELLRVIYVFDAKDADRINWMRCELANERNFMTYWNEKIIPSIQRLRFAAEDFAKVTAPVLTIHGDKDRSAAYSGAREWALRLPDARLVTVRNAAHGPWIEAPEMVFGAIETFLGGSWPEGAEKVTVVDRVAE